MHFMMAPSVAVEPEAFKVINTNLSASSGKNMSSRRSMHGRDILDIQKNPKIDGYSIYQQHGTFLQAIRTFVS